MISLLLKIKYKFHWLWSILEGINGGLFKILYNKKLRKELEGIFSQYPIAGKHTYRKILNKDIEPLHKLLENLEKDQKEYFEAHPFDTRSIAKSLRNPAFIMMGAFQGDKLVGYFFLRCFINKVCFIGRLVDKEYRNLGIGKEMNDILYNAAWNSGFRCFATLSKHNHLVMRAHKHNPHMVIRKDLANDHLLVEFVKNNK